MKTQKKIKKIVSQVVDSHEISCYYYKGALNRSLVDVLTVKSFDKGAENLHYFLSQKKEPPGCVGLYSESRKEENKECLQLTN